MNFVSRPMDESNAMEVADWTYDAPYDFYNMGRTEESVNELLNGLYWSVNSSDGHLIGFYCIGASAQVPAGHTCGAYSHTDQNVVDLGIGIRPDLTGRGLGTQFLSHVLSDVGVRHPAAVVRLTVAIFNQRAIKLYRRFGFSYRIQFARNGVVFQTMKRVPM